MAEATVSSQSILNGRTLNKRDLCEVMTLLERHDYSKASYHELGLRLKLSNNTLNKLKKDYGEVDSCFRECLASWLCKADGVENPTIDTLIAALRGIGENAVVDGINKERQSLVAVSTSEMSDRPVLFTLTSDGYSNLMQLDTINPGVRDLELIIDQVPELQEIANELQTKYGHLVIAVKRLLDRHKVNVKDAKLVINDCLKRKVHVVPKLMPCIDVFEKVHDLDSFFDFLRKYDFIGFLNYVLLKKLSQLVEDDGINQRFFEYEKEYCKLLSAAFSKNSVISFFEKKSDLSTTAPLGLPYFSFRLEKHCLPANVYTCVSAFGEFLCQSTQIETIKSSSLGRELIRSIESYTKPEERNNRTPLFNAVRSGNIGAVYILLTNGARADIVYKDGETLLHYASESGKVEMLELFIRRGDYDVNVSDKRKRTPLFNAVKSGSIEAVDILLTNGAKTDVVSNDGVTLLHCAGESGKVEMLEFWIRRGDYDVNVKDKNNRTPLFNAVTSGSVEAVEILLDNGANTDVVDKDSKSLLHYAGESGEIEMLEFWIRREDYDLNVKDKRKRTPLFNAVKKGSIEAVDILLTNRARTDVVDKVRKF
uniref:Death domain-containing protein n=1 Tax=Amphimedon queenslandica TaxID=400682 RepID=A0A1X7TP59_AMPQE